MENQLQQHELSSESLFRFLDLPAELRLHVSTHMSFFDRLNLARTRRAMRSEQLPEIYKTVTLDWSKPWTNRRPTSRLTYGPTTEQLLGSSSRGIAQRRSPLAYAVKLVKESSSSGSTDKSGALFSDTFARSLVKTLSVTKSYDNNDFLELLASLEGMPTTKSFEILSRGYKGITLSKADEDDIVELFNCNGDRPKPLFTADITLSLDMLDLADLAGVPYDQEPDLSEVNARLCALRVLIRPTKIEIRESEHARHSSFPCKAGVILNSIEECWPGIEVSMPFNYEGQEGKGDANDRASQEVGLYGAWQRRASAPM